MNQFSPNRPSAARSTSAFTLVELLVVIAIIGLLAALIVGGAGIASIKARTYRVQAERDALVTAIQQYKGHKGFYPPDNTNSPFLNPLFYELTGVVVATDGSGNFTNSSGDVLSPTDVNTVFKIGGFINSSPDPAQPAENFFKTVGKSTRTASFKVPQPGNTAHTFTLFSVPVPPGVSQAFLLAYPEVTGTAPTLWNYVSTNPTNNTTEFDLWMDVAWAGKTNRISNWEKDPRKL